MPAPAKISVQEVVNALLRWRGNVLAAAEELGIAPNSLYERINRSGLDLAAFRNRDPRKPVIPITGNTTVTGFPGTTDHAHTVASAQKNEAAPFRGGRSAPNIQRVSSPVAEFPTTTTRKTPRITPPHLDKLTEAKWHLQVLLRRDLTEQQILEMCLDDCLSDWIARKIASLQQAAEQPTPTDRPGRRVKDKR